jgi:hypothetical protein
LVDPCGRSDTAHKESTSGRQARRRGLVPLSEARDRRVIRPLVAAIMQ